MEELLTLRMLGQDVTFTRDQWGWLLADMGHPQTTLADRIRALLNDHHTD